MASSPVRGAHPVRSRPHRRPLHHEFTRPCEMKALSACLLITLCCACVTPGQTGSAPDTNSIQALSEQFLQALSEQFLTLTHARNYQQAVPIGEQLLKAYRSEEHTSELQSL